MGLCFLFSALRLGKTLLYLGRRLLIPQNMLRHGEGVFLDDVTLRDVEEALGVSVVPVMQDGAELLRAILGD